MHPRSADCGVCGRMHAPFAATILLFNQRHSGDPLKVRREMRTF